MGATRRGFLRLLGIGAVSAPALPTIAEAMTQEQIVPSAVTIVNAGSDYTSTPAVTFAPYNGLMAGPAWRDKVASDLRAIFRHYNSKLYEKGAEDEWTHGPASDF